MSAKSTKVSVLGCGWLGLPLASFLIKQGFNLKGSVRSTQKLALLQSKNIIPFLVDIDTENEIDLDFFAAEVLIISIPSKNLIGFQRLMSQIEKSSIKKIIFISTTSVYPNSEKLITEAHKTLETPLAKIEQLFVANTSFKLTIIRFGGLFGAERKPGNFFKNGRIIKNPEGVVNMIHQEDCIALIYRIIQKGITDDVFNACAEAHPTRREFYTKAKLDLGMEVPIFEENQPILMKKISSEKIKDVLGFTFKHSDLLNV